MDAIQAAAVVDRLAEKVGMAVEQVRPIAQEVFEQYITREALMAFGFYLMAAVGAVGMIVFWVKILRYGRKRKAEKPNWFEWADVLLPASLPGLFFAIPIIVGIIQGSCHLINYFTPLAGLLGL